jgi:hypothetical protein
MIASALLILGMSLASAGRHDARHHLDMHMLKNHVIRFVGTRKPRRQKQFSEVRAVSTPKVCLRPTTMPSCSVEKV